MSENLGLVIRHIRLAEKAELQLKIAKDAFQASHPIPPPIHSLKISSVEDGPTTTKLDNLLEEHLISPPLELFISPIGQQVILFTIPANPHAKGKSKGISYQSEM
ncbi:unnamed protein product [Lactuca saligna]|uniref:Uncharacterized protein n=1 Tax=Lactuca saligna TaxID=75948 RepID=A0AA35YGH7_LACSI|nr:unnamed protein product [Lactuca saligna]